MAGAFLAGLISGLVLGSMATFMVLYTRLDNARIKFMEETHREMSNALMESTLMSKKIGKS